MLTLKSPIQSQSKSPSYLTTFTCRVQLVWQREITPMESILVEASASELLNHVHVHGEL